MNLNNRRKGIIVNRWESPHTALTILLSLTLLVAGALAAGTPSPKDLKTYTANLPFAMPVIVEPVFPDRQVSIADHGAVADGRTLNTKAFAEAIRSCAEAGGGTVVVPAGTWLTGPIKLESNVNLHLERGALVQFSSRFEDFPLIKGLDGKSKRYQVAPPISGYRLTNIAITGEGIIDGAGDAWRPVKKDKLTARQWGKLTASGGTVAPDGSTWWPSKEAMQGEAYLKDLEKSPKERTAADYAGAREFLRPNLVQLVQCNGILLDGPTFQNSPRFHVHPSQSENIIVRNVKILCAWYAQNGDGLDLSSCRNVVAYNVTADVGDDAICIKPANIAGNQSPGPACQNIVIADCVVYHGHGGFVIGSESMGGARNIAVRNCTFVGTDVGLRFKSLRGKGGVVENIYVDNIQMRGIANEAILFDMYYGGGSPEEEATKGTGSKNSEPVTVLTPQFQNIFINHIVCNGASRAVLINGLPEMPVRNIHMENISISSEKGVMCVDADSITLNDAVITPHAGPVFAIEQSRNVNLKNVSYPDGAEVFLTVEGEKTGGIVLQGVDVSRAKKWIELGKNVRPEAVIQK